MGAGQGGERMVTGHASLVKEDRAGKLGKKKWLACGQIEGGSSYRQTKETNKRKAVPLNGEKKLRHGRRRKLESI